MESSSQKKKVWDSLVEFYRLYTSGLTRNEIERLLKRESAEVLSYYRRASSESEQGGKLKVVREIFISFLLKLTPARRLVYGVTLMVFVFAAASSHWGYAILSFLLLNLLLAFELADKMLAKDELEIAREIQVGLQPAESPDIPGLDVASFCQPAREVGGDYYDLLKMEDGRLAVIVGDVSGKGMPAALYAVKLQGLFESFVRLGSTPKEILIGMNRIFCQRLKKQYFITAALAIIDLEKKEIQIARAGHNPPLFCCPDHEGYRTLSSKGMGIGLSNGLAFSAELEELAIPVDCGASLLLYTDGITEAKNRSLVEFGEERLGELLERYKSGSAADIKAGIIRDLDTFSGRALLDDDATFVVLKIK